MEKGAGVAGELETMTREFFRALDAKDLEGLLGALGSDVQGVDEISRRWMRGSDEVGGQVRALLDMVDDIRSSIDDVHETVVGDVGTVTCWLEQDYVLQGAPQHVSAPTTVVFRRDSAAWKVNLFHSIPLPSEES
jgi:ketosteroid isomerase-like protein